MTQQRTAETGKAMFTFIICLLSLATFLEAEEVYQANCREPLGMQSGKIPDSAISASSSYDFNSVGPHNGRIRTENKGGAWCPRNQIHGEVYEWLQIDLGDLKVITVIETQGRFGNGQGKEFAPHYMLEYRRRDEGRWIRFQDHRGTELFQGNANTYLAEMREINPPIIARFIRIVPYSQYSRTVCMRVEVNGCNWTDGSVAYNMPQGAVRGAGIEMFDFIYDGITEDNYLKNGLGQLTDLTEGETNFRLDPMGLGRKAYEWVGWKNDTPATGPIEINFEFDKVRNFTQISVHANNMFSKDIRVFRKVEVFFSIGGTHYTSTPLVYNYLRDSLIEYARKVDIPIHHQIGRFVKLKFYFDSRWMMLSEINFANEIVPGNTTEETVPYPKEITPPYDPPYIQVSLGSKIPITLNKGISSTTQSTVEVAGNLTAIPLDHQSRTTNSRFHDGYIGVIIGAIIVLTALIGAGGLFVFIKKRKKKYNSYSNNVKTMIDPPVFNFHVNDLGTQMYEKRSDSSLMKNCGGHSDTEDSVRNYKQAAYQEPSISSSQPKEMPSSSHSGESTDTNVSSSRESNSQANCYLVVNLPPKPVFTNELQQEEQYFLPSATPPPIPPPPHPSALSTSQNMLNSTHCEGRRNEHFIPTADMLWGENERLPEFPKESLRYVDTLGEGQYGQVYLYETTHTDPSLLMPDILDKDPNNRPINYYVAVKSLREASSEKAKDDFGREIKLLSKLRDPNIVQVLGVCTSEEPVCVVVEYMRYGDLNQYLKRHVLEGTNVKKPGIGVLSNGCLMYMASQIASGMKYLETLNMVHRDLACRNCLVGYGYTIKISDFGMSRSLYHTDYYRIEGKAVLPIRWMAWESVLLGKFTSKSDSWSFAVTLWEILTLAREQPFSYLTDEQVIENCGHYYHNDDKLLFLSQPLNCSKEVYDLMLECWNRDEIGRPTFREIHMFLQRKNMGFDPSKELTYSSQS